MAAIPGHRAELWAQSGSSVAFTGEACHQVSGLVYEITSTTKRNWDPDATITVYDNGSPVSSVTLQRPVGRIVFTSAPTGPVTVSGKYLPTAKVGYVRSWELSIKNDTLETTSLGDTTRTFVGLGMPQWSIGFEKLVEDETWAELAMDNDGSGQRMLLKLYEDRSGSNRLVWAGYATVDSSKESLSLEDLVDQGLTLVGEGIPYYVDETD